MPAPLPAPGGTVVLSPNASHHLITVCRHARGAPLVVFDGMGREADAALTGIEGDVAVLTITSSRRTASPRHALHLVLGVPKGPALEHALRMAVEVGATHIHPVLSAHSVARSDRQDRWMRVVESACQQCGRADRPIVSALGALEEAIDRVPDDHDRRIAVPGARHVGAAHGAAAVAVGPEGGFAAAEITRCIARGWRPTGLGPWVLRTDTAVAIGLALIHPTGG